jgi:hypothetical protein
MFFHNDILGYPSPLYRALRTFGYNRVIFHIVYHQDFFIEGISIPFHQQAQSFAFKNALPIMFPAFCFKGYRRHHKKHEYLNCPSLPKSQQVLPDFFRPLIEGHNSNCFAHKTVDERTKICKYRGRIKTDRLEAEPCEFEDRTQNLCALAS